MDRKTMRGLVSEARALLDDRWTGRYTLPSSGLYPHQWSWDTCWLAMGLSTYCPDRARRELKGLFEAQWTNGMVPQIVFNPEYESGYFPGPSRWRAEVSGRVPPGVSTSGIIQPPVHAMAVRTVYERAEDHAVGRAFVEEMYPFLLRWHRYLYRERDPHGEYLVYIRHPWESLDNSPDWDEPLSSLNLVEGAVEPYERLDLNRGVPATHRPTGREYDRYVHLVDTFRKHQYDEAKIYSGSGFFVQELLVNSVLCRANRDLAFLAREIGEDDSEPRHWAHNTTRAMREKLWASKKGRFVSWDLQAERPLVKPTASMFLPYFGGVPTEEQSERMFDRFESVGFCPARIRNDGCFYVPTYSTTSIDFNGDNYWRGPVWGYTNWLLSEGLHRYGFEKKAREVRNDFTELLKRHGFSEYWNPTDGRPLGERPFPTSAALLLDMVERRSFDR